jgi:hypothetical protein
LTLQAGAWGDPIRCSLRTVRLEDDPQYEALSYAWGDPAICRPIIVDGRECQATVNLVSALRRLRFLDQARRLWIDALCINQADNAEKSHQVRLMDKIYLQASRGLLWLGEFEHELQSSANLPPNPPPIPSSTIMESAAQAAFSTIKMLAGGKHLLPCLEAPTTAGQEFDSYEAVRLLLDLPWWNRIWTVQEAVLPGQTAFVCGSLLLPFGAFSSANSNINKHFLEQCCAGISMEQDRILRLFCSHIGSIDWFRRNRLGSQPAEVLASFRHRSASDPRDKVFALLSLASAAHDQGQREHIIRPDYSMGWREVYQQTTMRLIDTTRSLRPLVNVREDDRDSSLPSWVPDWRATTHVEFLDEEAAWGNLYEHFNASGDAAFKLDNSRASERELVLRGTQIDTIVASGRITSVKQWGLFTLDAAEWWALLMETTDCQVPYPYGGTYAQAFSSSMTGGMVNCEGTRFRRLQSTDRYANGSVWWTGPFEKEFQPILHCNKRFFVTEKGLVGLGSPDLAVGDKICVCRGGKVPFILRQLDTERRENCFAYVGHTYVHGIMDGEAVRNGCTWDWLTLV